MKRQTSSETLPDFVLEAALIITERIEDFIIDDVVNDPYKLIKAYKQAAAIAHPDRGGSQEEFVALQSSLAILKRWHEIKTTDELKLEVEIADQLDDIAAELNGIAEQLRRKPYVAVEGQLVSQQERLAAVMGLGKAVKENAS